MKSYAGCFNGQAKREAGLSFEARRDGKDTRPKQVMPWTGSFGRM